MRAVHGCNSWLLSNIPSYLELNSAPERRGNRDNLGIIFHTAPLVLMRVDNRCFCREIRKIISNYFSIFSGALNMVSLQLILPVPAHPFPVFDSDFQLVIS